DSIMNTLLPPHTLKHGQESPPPSQAEPSPIEQARRTLNSLFIVAQDPVAYFSRLLQQVRDEFKGDPAVITQEVRAVQQAIALLLHPRENTEETTTSACAAGAEETEVIDDTLLEGLASLEARFAETQRPRIQEFQTFLNQLARRKHFGSYGKNVEVAKRINKIAED